MPDYPYIKHYYESLQQLVAVSGSDNELVIRPAFQNCLAAYCAAHREKLTLVPELRTPTGVIPDGTVKDTLRMARGYWEAKDSRDDLDAEIERKFNLGYPQENILFEDSRTAALIQSGEQAMRVDMSRPGELHRLIRRFLDYELPQIEGFRRAQNQFKTDLPAVLSNLREAVEAAEVDNRAYQDAASGFLVLCRHSISPDVSASDVREMLLQHILTKDIFLRVFGEDQFHRENNIARQLDTLERTFFTGDVRRGAVDRLITYYGAIGRAAHDIADYAEKQQFLKAIYEDFYQAYNPAAADRLGVVYTPNEIVDFIIRGADHLLHKHFGRTLADDNVQILDPATGTGTFVTSLIDYLPAERVEYKYRNEIHANEVAILPYYIANLNIEYSYKERTGQYLEFPNLCFVDTIDNMDWQGQGATGGAVQRQSAFNLGGLSSENWLRVQEQNEQPISVIIGNPPYNANQQNENDNNKNREYPEIDRRISNTYIAASTAQKTKQYDMYKRFIRWASDRLDDDGIVAFITNRSYIDSRQDDGFRKVVLDEFSDLYIVDLGGDIRKNGRVGNVFGIMTGVAVGFLVRHSQRQQTGVVHYHALTDELPRHEKLSILRRLHLSELDFQDITPDSKNNWLEQSNSDFERLIPLANRETKLAKAVADEQAVFRLYSLGVVTNRDEWVYDWNADDLGRKVRAFINSYEETRAMYGGQEVDNATLGTSIKWTRDLKRQLRLDMSNVFDRSSVCETLYRPFVKKPLYFNQRLNEMQYQIPLIFPGGTPGQNITICLSGTSSSKPFQVLATDQVHSLDLLEKTQCLPLYRYTADGERVSNITEWGLRRINEHYRKEWGEHFDDQYPDGITAEDIFAYTYAVLHDPVYRHDYRVDLLREFPRLPLYHDFEVWARMGRELLDLHLGFETAEPYPLERRDVGANNHSPLRAILRADKERGRIVLDEQTTLAGVPADAWRYQLGSRSALEWVLDQYKERKPRDLTIRERFNTYRFADHKERVIELLRRVCTVSVKTMALVDSMAFWLDGQLIVFDDRDKNEWETMALEAFNSYYDESDDDPEYQAWLASLPDIREQSD